MIIVVDGCEMEITDAMLKEIHKQEHIEWGRSILENHIPSSMDLVTDEQCFGFIDTLQDKMLSNNGELEIETLKEVFGEDFLVEDECRQFEAESGGEDEGQNIVSLSVSRECNYGLQVFYFSIMRDT